VVPAIVEFVDIAGLVAGASKGEGLGNQFLSHIRETDAIVNVVRCFEDENVIHVAGKVDPIADIEVIQTELCLADLATVEKSLVRYNKQAKAGGDKEAQRLVDVLQKCQAALDEAQPVRSIDFSKEELVVLKPLCLITAKPAMFVGNVAETGFENNPFLDRLREYAAKQNAPVVAICAKTEAELADMADEDKVMFLQEMGQDEPGLNRLIRAAFKLLGLQTYFTAGREGGARLDHPCRRHRAAGRGRDPHRFRTRLHPRADHRLRRLRRLQAASRGPRTPARCAPKARSTSSRTAT
jgi:GTP-binding protein YchF